MPARTDCISDGLRTISGDADAPPRTRAKYDAKSTAHFIASGLVVWCEGCAVSALGGQRTKRCCAERGGNSGVEKRETLVYRYDPPQVHWQAQAVLLLRWALACTERDHSPSAGGQRETLVYATTPLKFTASSQAVLLLRWALACTPESRDLTAARLSLSGLIRLPPGGRRRRRLSVRVCTALCGSHGACRGTARHWCSSALCFCLYLPQSPPQIRINLLVKAPLPTAGQQREIIRFAAPSRPVAVASRPHSAFCYVRRERLVRPKSR